ncbi:MAG: holin family protein [Pseudomonadota bacterium]
MGLMRWLFGRGVRSAGAAVRDVAEVFTPNATKRMELGHAAYMAAHDGHRAEFLGPRTSFFDGFVNALNRLPRPMLALGTLGLFAYAMENPEGFTLRMQGLAHVPDPLWWLLGAVVSFYFGAREAHYFRQGRPQIVQGKKAPRLEAEDPNPALSDWQRSQS